MVVLYRILLTDECLEILNISGGNKTTYIRYISCKIRLLLRNSFVRKQNLRYSNIRDNVSSSILMDLIDIWK
jgi:hypothetical protein